MKLIMCELVRITVTIYSFVSQLNPAMGTESALQKRNIMVGREIECDIPSSNSRWVVGEHNSGLRVTQDCVDIIVNSDIFFTLFIRSTFKPQTANKAHRTETIIHFIVTMYARNRKNSPKDLASYRTMLKTDTRRWILRKYNI